MTSLAFVQSTSSTSSPFLFLRMLSMFLIRWRDTLENMTTGLLYKIRTIDIHLFRTSLNSNLIPNFINLGFCRTASAILDSTLCSDGIAMMITRPVPVPHALLSLCSHPHLYQPILASSQALKQAGQAVRADSVSLQVQRQQRLVLF